MRCLGSSINDLKTLGLRGLSPQAVGTAHRARPLRTGLPGIVDVVAGPDHQRGDLGGVGLGNEGVTTDKTRSLALRRSIAMQQCSGLLDAIWLGPMMRQHTNHATSGMRHETMHIAGISGRP